MYWILTENYLRHNIDFKKYHNTTAQINCIYSVAITDVLLQILQTTRLVIAK